MVPALAHIRRCLEKNIIIFLAHMESLRMTTLVIFWQSYENIWKKNWHTFRDSYNNNISNLLTQLWRFLEKYISNCFDTHTENPIKILVIYLTIVPDLTQDKTFFYYLETFVIANKNKEAIMQLHVLWIIKYCTFHHSRGAKISLTRGHIHSTLFSPWLMNGSNKLECLLLPGVSSQV